MDLSKPQKTVVINWIDKQFESSSLFPCDCVVKTDGSSCICGSHIKAYKAWKKTPNHRSHISAWINDWLSDEKRQSLLAKLKAHETLIER